MRYQWWGEISTRSHKTVISVTTTAQQHNTKGYTSPSPLGLLHFNVYFNIFTKYELPWNQSETLVHIGLRKAYGCKENKVKRIFKMLQNSVVYTGYTLLLKLSDDHLRPGMSSGLLIKVFPKWVTSSEPKLLYPWGKMPASINSIRGQVSPRTGLTKWSGKVKASASNWTKILQSARPSLSPQCDRANSSPFPGRQMCTGLWWRNHWASRKTAKMGRQLLKLPSQVVRTAGT